MSPHHFNRLLMRNWNFKTHHIFGIRFENISSRSIACHDVKYIFIFKFCGSNAQFFRALPNDLISRVSDAVLMTCVVHTSVFGTFFKQMRIIRLIPILNSTEDRSINVFVLSKINVFATIDPRGFLTRTKKHFVHIPYDGFILWNRKNDRIKSIVKMLTRGLLP